MVNTAVGEKVSLLPEIQLNNVRKYVPSPQEKKHILITIIR
jgi:hypothetical protein